MENKLFDGNPVIAIMRTARNPTTTNKVLEMATAINTESAKLEAIGRPIANRQETFELRKRELQAAVTGLIKADVQANESVIAKARAAWEKETGNNLNRRHMEMQTAEVRYRAMNPDELRSVLQGFCEAEFILEDPVVVDAAFAVGMASSIDAVETGAMREIVVSKRYAEPWLQNAEAQQSLREIKVLQDYEQSAVPIIEADGKMSGVTFGELLNMQGE